ncbi:MAG: hypothetical protein Q9212_000752 [Teloschistes hypoglaucus]
MSLPSPAPAPKKHTASSSKAAGSSWLGNLITSQPPKASKAEITFHSPTFASIQEQKSSRFAMDETSPKHQFLPLSLLPSIAELPKQELPSGPNADQTASGTKESSQRLETDNLPKPHVEAEKGKEIQDSGAANPPQLSSLPPADKAARIPLPQSRHSDDSAPSARVTTSTDSSPGLEAVQHTVPSPKASNMDASDPVERSHEEESESWTSRLASILPRVGTGQSVHQDTPTAGARASRSSSVAPGAYPDSESTGRSSHQTPDSDRKDLHPTNGQSESNRYGSDSRSLKPRKSVSIVTPDAESQSGDNSETSLKDTRPKRDSIGEKNASSLLEDKGYRTEATERSNENVLKEEAPSSTEGQGVGKTPFQADRGVLANTLQAPKPRSASLSTRSSSIAAWQGDADKVDGSTLYERESIAPSEADNSSLQPLFPSSPRERRSSHFSESLNDDHEGPGPGGSKHGTLPKGKNRDSSPLKDDDTSSQSTIVSSITSEEEKAERKAVQDDRASRRGTGMDLDRRGDSLPPPAIVVRDASEAEESLRTPPLVAPATTPVQDDSLPRRRTTFVALGEVLPDQRAIKLPTKRRKLYVRKARYAVLRQPILNALVGRQVGAQAKVALKKLADGELFVIEPPTSF